MNSLKNTIVAILLLGVSYGVYQVLTKTEPKSLSTAEFHALNEPEIQVPGNLLEPPPPTESDDSFGEPAENRAPAPPQFTSPPVEPPPAAPVVERPIAPTTTETAPSQPAPWSAPPVNKPLPASGQSAPPIFGSNTTTSPPPFGSTASTPPTNNRAPESLPPFQNNPEVPKLSAAPLAELGAPAGSLPIGQPNSAEANIPAQSGNGSIGLTAATAPLPTLENSMQTARQLIAAGQMRQALAELTTQLQNPALSAQDQATLYKWLDTLAGKVIYSTEHHVQNQPHIVQPSETLASLADTWRIPQQLVYNINREKITNPFELQPGTELKKIPGPFRAEIDRTSQTVTLFLDELYAGRFKCVSVAADMPPGACRVENKMESGHPAGQFLLQTNNPAVSLHAQPAAGSPSGCCFTQGDARDLFSILSVGSEIKITR